jgi:hypothetical protein
MQLAIITRGQYPAGSALFAAQRVIALQFKQDAGSDSTNADNMRKPGCV